MPHFCHQISFTTSAWTRVLENTKDRFEAVRSPIEALGGTIHAAFFAMDSYDVLIISEFPDDVSTADIAIRFSAGGEVASIHTTRLLGASQALEAVQKAGSYSYRPVSRPQTFAVSAT